ncbi:MAG: DUF86 domain-containing protein [Candidatus Wildermuthbacteria bacterium]|nr:DUF86 domain-containing protein [Candidatus Wildermuthbacteria bacterium]
MTSLAKEKIFEKLENFGEYLKYLRQLEKEAGEEAAFIADFRLFGSVERYLQLSIQSVIDIAHLLIIDLNLKRPEDNYEAISLLHDQNIVSGDLAQILTRMIGLRNILVHEYGKIDRAKIYEVLKNQLYDLERFQKEILGYLEK